MSVVVTNPNGQRATLNNGFTYNQVLYAAFFAANTRFGPNAPALTAFAGGEALTLVGAGFLPNRSGPPELLSVPARCCLMGYRWAKSFG